MRIWDIPDRLLCDRHLTGEHVELHTIWNALTQDKKGWRNHPETKRWEGKLRALYLRHEEIIKEFNRRGWHHESPLDEKLATGSDVQDKFVNSISEQLEILKKKSDDGSCCGITCADRIRRDHEILTM